MDLENFSEKFFRKFFFLLDVMASEASLEHSLLDVMPERSEVRVRVSRERSELRAFSFRFG